MKSLYIVDVSSMFFRAFYAIRPLSNSQGLPTNAIYGFLAMITKLLKDNKPDYLAFCYDVAEPSFRKELDENYKAHRTEMPSELALQIPYIYKLADALGICSFQMPRYEADDLIGSLAHWGEKQGLSVVIVSGDKDFNQLVNDNISLYDTMKEVRTDASKVVEKWGVPPEKFRDYLAIVGDSSDNIPGVTGIGQKGAATLLQQFSTLDDIYAHLDQIKSASIRKKLETSRDQAFLSRTLVTIVTDLDLPVSLDQLRPHTIKPLELRELLRELEFRTFERTLLDSAPNATAEKSPPKATTHPTEKRISLQEFKGLIQPKSEVWAIAVQAGVFFAVNDQVFSVDADLPLLAKCFDEQQVQWKGFDLKEFWKMLNLQNPHAAWDHKLAAYVLRAGPSGELRELTHQFYGEAMDDTASPGQWLEVHRTLEKNLREQLGLQIKILDTIELPLVSVLYKMEKLGVLLDKQILQTQSQGLSTDIRKLEAKIYKEAGEEFNIGSPKQLSQILFEKMKIPPGRKTKTGYSTDTEVLEKLGPAFPIGELIVEWRELAKLKSTYVDVLPQLVDPQTGRVHTTFNQALTTTGRLSSSNPNLQNIPIRTPRGSAIRKAFIADPGCCLLSADYSQIELRILAHVSDDPGLKSAFAQDLDIHAATAAIVFEQPLEKITPDLRRMAKAVNFGIAYGQGAFGLSETLGIERGEASRLIEQYFERFPKVRAYMDNTIAKAKEQGYVESIFGRRRYLDELKSSNPAIKKFGERAAINAPMQGTASDLIKMAMIQIDQKLQLRMLLQVHDELIFEVSESQAQALGEEVRQVMENVAQLSVPLKVNVASGLNWGDAHR